MQLTLDATIANLPTAERAASELDDMETLVRNYRPRLLRFVAFSIGDPDLAESITQDCFLKAYGARDRFRGDCSINTWLTSIAVNLIRDQQRLQKFRFWRQARATAIDITDAANFLPSHESSPESRLLVKEKADQVQAALLNLSPNQRNVFLMRFSEELELSEISAITGIPVNTVKTHLHRALKSVRAEVRAAQAEGRAIQAEGRSTQPEGRSTQPEGRSTQPEGRSTQPANPDASHRPTAPTPTAPRKFSSAARRTLATGRTQPAGVSA